MTDYAPHEFQALATLVHLARRSRQVRDVAELNFLLVNETHALAPYRQAALWLRDGSVATLSGVVSPEANAPYVQWLVRVFRHLPSANTPVVLDATSLPANEWAEWGEWLPQHGLYLPLPGSGRRLSGGGLLLARDEPWAEAEIALLEEWTATWAQARANHDAVRLLGRVFAPRSRILRSPSLWLAIALLAVLFLPVRMSVLAPAELVPLKPAVIRAPLDGVVDRVLVSPNQTVAVGAPLFEFDRANVQNRLQVAQRAVATVQAEYRQKAQQALFDPASKSQLAVLRSEERRVGKECRRLCRSRWSPYH
jgi:hypothetical protein